MKVEKRCSVCLTKEEVTEIILDHLYNQGFDSFENKNIIFNIQMKSDEDDYLDERPARPCFEGVIVSYV